MLHRAWIECCNKIHKNFKMYQRSTPPWSSAILEKYKNYTHLAALKIPLEVFHITISAFNIKWAKWSQYQITDVDCGIVINFSIVYLAKSHNHLITTIKHNIIRKLFMKSKHGHIIEKEWHEKCRFLAWRFIRGNLTLSNPKRIVCSLCLYQ